MSEAPHVGVIGGASLVGRQLVPLLARRGDVLACSRRLERQAPATAGRVRWHETGSPVRPGTGPVPEWVALCPLWAVPEHLDWLEQAGVERLVAVSSMSVVTKAWSPDPTERLVASRLAAAENLLGAWADGRGVALTLIVPTMIYDGVTDGNVAAIAAWVGRHGWFPLCGPALGRRQPVHAGDVAAACLAALERRPPDRRYALSGGEVLPFRELVIRTCQAHGLAPRLVRLPPAAWNLAATIVRWLGLAGGATVAMGRRMNEDLSADHAAAARDLGFSPRPFAPGSGTLAGRTGQIGTRPDGRRNER
jgi:nucleoside-diphosphate-sugar epimerase